MPVMDPGFYKKLLEVTSEVQMKPEDLLNVMAVESGIDPTAHNKDGNASGLIQFMPSTLKNLGFKGSHTDFRRLSASDQLDYVKQYVLNNMKYNGGPFKSAAQYYVANFVPVALKLPGVKAEDPSTILVAKNPDKPHLPGVDIHMERIYYDANSGLDVDHDGAITYGDIQTVLSRASVGKNFRSALAQLQNSTGYQPSHNPAQMIAMKKTIPANDIMSVLNRYLQQVAASERQNKRLYKKFLPNNTVVIQISASSFTDTIEFARVLCSALDEELLATAFTHTNGRQVEVECRIPGPEYECMESVRWLVASMVESFETATRKIGGVKVKTQLVMNKRSSYQQISLKSADSQYRRFLLKFV